MEWYQWNYTRASANSTVDRIRIKEWVTVMIREKLEKRKRKYIIRKRIKLSSAIFAMLMAVGIIHKSAVYKTDAIFRYSTDRTGEDKITVTHDVYKIDTDFGLTHQNLSVTEAAYDKITE
ncbi:MAG: hypothetical protein GX045_07530 [Clostridiaceae bacterium]|jgi:hypothetical protein|nr:hypothetical protein [Clostridiaceae bacterium]